MVSYSKRLAQQDAARNAQKAAHKAAKKGNSGQRRQCPHCSGGWTLVPKALRTTKRTGSGDCGWCGGDGYLDPGDRGY